MCCNTDAQHLMNIQADVKLQLGKTLTQGLGCGANPNGGRAAAEESKDEIIEIIKSADLVFITAGMYYSILLCVMFCTLVIVVLVLLQAWAVGLALARHL